MWKRKRILVTVKANPEKSKRHGPICCTAGITEDGEWIRIYPVSWGVFSRRKINRYSWIEAEVQPASEKLKRKESHKIRESTIRVVDRSLSDSADWKARNRVILPLLNRSIEDLRELFERERVSLGLVKPKTVLEFYKTMDLDEMIEKAIATKSTQRTLEGETVPELRPYEHIFKYKWSCNDPRCNGHDMTCEDWELFAAVHNWQGRYGSYDELWEKLHNRFFDYLYGQRDLYFYVGTHSQYPVWMIIGVYYPPKTVGG